MRDQLTIKRQGWIRYRCSTLVRQSTCIAPHLDIPRVRGNDANRALDMIHKGDRGEAEHRPYLAGNFGTFRGHRVEHGRTHRVTNVEEGVLLLV